MRFSKQVTVVKKLELRVTEVGTIERGEPATPADLAAAGYIFKGDVRRITESAVNQAMDAVSCGANGRIGEALRLMLEQLEAL